MLHSFSSYYTTRDADGGGPQAAILGINGRLCGTASAGGTNYYPYGTAFEMSLSGKECVLHSSAAAVTATARRRGSSMSRTLSTARLKAPARVTTSATTMRDAELFAQKPYGVTHYCSRIAASTRCIKNASERSESGRFGQDRSGTGHRENPYYIGLFGSHTERPGPLGGTSNPAGAILKSDTAHRFSYLKRTAVAIRLPCHSDA
jgi:hypothetical protein